MTIFDKIIHWDYNIYIYILDYLFEYYLNISLMQSVNGAKLLNITPLFLSSIHLAASSSPASVIVKVSPWP